MANSRVAFWNFVGCSSPRILSIQSRLNPQVRSPGYRGPTVVSLLSTAHPHHHPTFPRTTQWPSALSLVPWGAPLWSTISQLRPGTPKGVISLWHSSYGTPRHGWGHQDRQYPFPEALPTSPFPFPGKCTSLERTGLLEHHSGSSAQGASILNPTVPTET